MRGLLIVAAVVIATACSQPAPATQGSGTTTPPDLTAAPAPATPAATTTETAPASPPPQAAPLSPVTRSSPAPADAPRSVAPAPAATPAASSEAATPIPPKPVAPPPPRFREVTVPAGTSLSVTILSNLASNTSHVEDAVKASLAEPVVVDGVTAVPAKAQITGTVTDVKESGRVKGKASLALRFDRLIVRGETQRISSARVMLEAQDNKKSDVKKGGLGAGLGAVVGGVVGGGKGAAIGAVAGGTGAILGTKGGEISVPAGTVVNVLLQEPFSVQVPLR